MTKKKNVEPPVSVVFPSEIVQIPLFNLQRADENVRTDAPNGDIEGLADDIAGHGLLQSLIGYEDIDTQGEIMTFIVGGGRRLAALQMLVERGLDPDFKVPVLIRTKNEAIELSLAENLQRRDMNPVDEFKAFAALQDLHPGEMGVTALAQRFGFTERHVRQRMRLADLAEPILAKLAAGGITLDAAMAYASAPDTGDQLRVFNAEEKNNWKPHTPATIREQLRKLTYSVNSPTFKYVGKAAYEKAGGGYNDDLFSTDDDERTVLHPSLLSKLAEEKASRGLAKLAKANGLTSCLLSPTVLRSYSYENIKIPKAPTDCVRVDGEYGLHSAGLIAKIEGIGCKIIHGIASVYDGKLELANTVFVPSEFADALVEKRPSYQPYVPPTEEERAAAQRARRIESECYIRALRKLLDGSGLKGRVQVQDRGPREVGSWLDLGACVSNLCEIHLTVDEFEAEREDVEAAIDGILADEKRQREEAEAARIAEQEAHSEGLVRFAHFFCDDGGSDTTEPELVEADGDIYTRDEDGGYSDGEYGVDCLLELVDRSGEISRFWMKASDRDTDPEGTTPADLPPVPESPADGDPAPVDGDADDYGDMGDSEDVVADEEVEA